MEILLSSLITGTCQLFLVFRVKVISGGNWWIVSVLAVVSFVHLGLGLASGIMGVQPDTDITRLASECSSSCFKI